MDMWGEWQLSCLDQAMQHTGRNEEHKMYRYMIMLIMITTTIIIHTFHYYNITTIIIKRYIYAHIRHETLMSRCWVRQAP
jgi:hypothetical protein